MRGWVTAGSAAWPLASLIRWRPCNSRPWATACATNTASSSRPFRTAGNTKQPDNWLRRPDPWEVARPHETGRSEAQLLVRDARRQLARDPRPAIESDRHSVRSPGGGLRRQDDQYAPALGCGGTRLLQLSGIQQRRFRRRAGRDARGRVADAGLVSGRLDQPGAGIALCAGVFSGRLFAGGSRAAFPREQHRLERAARTKSPSSSTTRIRRWRFPS